MKKKFLYGIALVCCQCIALFTVAQTKASISGTVSDSTAQKPLQYVTIELYRGGNMTQAVKAGFTNDKGKYNFNNIDTGSYTIIISHTGFLEKQEAIEVKNGDPIELKPVLLSPSNGALQGVVVKTRKPLVEQQDDKIIFNVENDPATKTETAIDI